MMQRYNRREQFRRGNAILILFVALQSAEEYIERLVEIALEE
jgi:hypothetical protein